MNLLNLIKYPVVLFFLISSSMTYAKYELIAEKRFGSWLVEVNNNDFDNEKDITLSTDIYSIDDHVKIGHISFNRLYKSKNLFASGAYIHLSNYEKNIIYDGTWPACEYNFLRYKIDNQEINYFPSRDSSCHEYVVPTYFSRELLKGSDIKINLRNTTGIANLSDLKAAWKFASEFLK